MKKILQAALGIIIATLGLSGWIILIKNNAQGDFAFIVCMLCIFILIAGIITLAEACGFEI